MNHINEGLYILDKINSSECAKKAFCLHPLVQADGDLGLNIELLDNRSVSSKALYLALEYRNIANQYLSHRKISDISEIALSPLKDVNDMLIADKLIETQKTYGNPKAYTIAWAKNQKQEVVEIVRKLIYEGGSKIGLNLSVQTMDDNVLDIIKRKNLEMNKIEEVFKMCEENNSPVYSELIVGLPGETLESWKENFFKLYKRLS